MTINSPDEFEPTNLDDDQVAPSQGTKDLEVPPGARDVNQRGQFEHSNPVGRESPIAPYFGLSRWHPFTELFCSIADRIEPGEDVIEARRSFAQKRAKSFTTALVLDYIVQIVAVIGIIAAIGFIALRAAGVDIEIVKIYIPWFRAENTGVDR